MSITTRFDTLLVYDPSYARTTVNIWVADSSPAEETVLGKLFMVSLIETPEKINQEVITVIQEEVRKHYYHNAAWTAERALEYTLEQVNQRLHHLINEGVNQWLERSHLLIGALHHHQLVLAPAGVIHSYLLRGSRIHDVLGHPSGAIQPLRIFSQLIVGRVEAGDHLLFCTPSLLDYFSLEKLRRTIVDVTPAEAVRGLEATLLGADPGHAFGAIIVELESAEQKVPTNVPVGWTPAVPAATQVSMEQLISRQHQTEKFLAPSLWPTVRQGLESASRALDRFFRTVVLRRPPRRMISSPAPTGIPRVTGPKRSIAINRLTEIVRSWFVRSKYLWQRGRLARQPSFPVVASPTTVRVGSPLERLVLWWQHLTRSQQTLATVGVALILVFSVSIVRSAGPRQPNQAATENIAAITEHLNAAEAALLYGGEDRTAAEMQAAEDLIDKLPNRRAEDKARRQALADRLQSLIEKTSKQTVVADPTNVASFTPTLPNFRPQQLYLLKNHILTFDPASNTAAVVTVSSTDPPTVIPAIVDIGDMVTGATTGATTVMFATDRAGFAELDVAKKTWKPFDATWPVKQPVIQFVSFFQNRIYVLDRSHQEIYRFAKGTSSLGSGAVWLKEAADIAKARASVVDGSIYILQPGGSVEQWVSGRQSEWQLATIRPALTEAIRLWTNASSKHLYLVDPTKQRIVVFDKDGQLVDQYTSPAWTNLRDVVADEANQQAYILNGTTIYRIQLKH